MRPPARVSCKLAAGTGLAGEVAGLKTTCDEDYHLINNRQNGRRRGRGGGGPRPNNAPNPGNRQDNRSRGNAAQLHEKYKAMARDMQLAGDRVQTEFYLQFADHYFRVLNETRSRFEEQRPRSRDDFMSDDDEDGDEAMMGQDDGDGDGRDDRPQPRMDREQRFDRDNRGDREQRPDRAFGRLLSSSATKVNKASVTFTSWRPRSRVATTSMRMPIEVRPVRSIRA